MQETSADQFADVIGTAITAAAAGKRVVVLSSPEDRRPAFLATIAELERRDVDARWSWMRWNFLLYGERGVIAIETDGRHLAGQAIDTLLVLGDPRALRTGLLEYAETLVVEAPVEASETPTPSRALGRALGVFSSINEVRVVGAFLRLAKPGGDVSWDELRAEISEAEGQRHRISTSVIGSGLERALSSGTLEREALADRRYSYRIGPKLAEVLGEVSEP